jgi:hypothetical protein
VNTDLNFYAFFSNYFLFALGFTFLTVCFLVFFAIVLFDNSYSISCCFHVFRSAFGNWFFITILHNGSIVMKLIFRILHVSYVQLLCLTLSILYVDPFRINQTCVVA